MKPAGQSIVIALVLASLALALPGCHRNPVATNDKPDATPTPSASPAAPVIPTVPLAAAVPSPSAAATPAPTAPPPPQVIVSDTFLENNNAENYQHKEITGVTPAPIDLPGGAWQLASGDGSYEAYLTSAAANAAACFHNTASAGLSLSSDKSYVRPAILTVSASLAFAGDSAKGYCLLGFYSVLPGKSAYNPMLHFTGLALLKDGSLQLIEDGKASTLVKYTGSYDPAQGVTLSYQIDTAKGSLSNVALAGSSSSYPLTSSAFSAAATAFVGIGGATDGQSFCYVNDLVLSTKAVPPVPSQDPSQTN